MTTQQIEDFLTPDIVSKVVNISFKVRNNVKGIFLTSGDFEDLKTKNLWRILPETRLEEWNKTRNLGLARIYNGAEFTKLKV